jgi:hypothetical protein
MLCYSSASLLGNISQCLREKRKSAHGLGWRNVLTSPSSIMSDSEVGGADEMRISVSGVDDIDTTQEASRGCSNVSPDASGTRECLMQRQVGDGTGTDVGDVSAGSHTGLWTGTGIAVSLTGEGNPAPFSSTTSSSDDHPSRSISHLTSGGTVDSTAECLNLSLEELRSHRLVLGKRVRTVCGSLPHANGGQEVWKKVRTVSLLHGGPSDIVSGCHADTAADDDENSEGGEGGDGGDDMDDDMERDEDENEDIDRDGETIGDETDEPSSHSVPTVTADGQTERWRERQEKAMMLAGKLAALASTSTSTSTSIAQQGSASRDVSEESATDDVSADQATVSQDEGQGQEQRGVKGHDGLEGTEAKGKTKRGLERRRRRSKSEMKGVSLTSTAHTVTSSSSSSSDSAAESLPLSPSSAHSGTSNRSRGGLKGKRDLPVKSVFRESKYLLSKYVTRSSSHDNLSYDITLLHMIATLLYSTT